MTTITVTIWHNIARDAHGHPAGMLEGYQPGDPVVRVFTYPADPAGRSPQQIAEEAFAICNDHPADEHGQDLARRYYQRQLRSLSFPGKRPCCPRSCCVHCGPRVVRIAVDSATCRKINADLGASRIVVVLPTP